MSEEFDWVNARNLCSVDRVFEKLRLDVKGDVERRQALREPLPPPDNGFNYGFAFSGSGSMFSASLQGNRLKRSVIFALRGKHIIVSDENEKELFRATVTLSNDRECRLVVVKKGDVEKDEMEGWQFRKKALESLFFSDELTPDFFGH